MESSRQYFCHSCKKEFKRLSNDQANFDDGDVSCQHCGDFFVELIEDQDQLRGLFDLYKNEIDAQKLAQTQQISFNSNTLLNSQTNFTDQNQSSLSMNQQNINTTSATSHQNKLLQQDDSDEFFDCQDEEMKELNSAKERNLQNPNEEEKKQSQQKIDGQSQQQIPNLQTTNSQNENQSAPRIQAFIQNPISQVVQGPNQRSIITTQVNQIDLTNMGGQGNDWMNNIQNQINELMRSQGQQQVINQNGQNINFQTVSGNIGNSTIHIANIESDLNIDIPLGQDFIDQNIDGLPADDGNGDWEDVEEENVAQIQEINIDLNIDSLLEGDLNNDNLQQAILQQVQQQLQGLGQNINGAPPQNNQQPQTATQSNQQQPNQQQNQQQQNQQNQPQFSQQNYFQNGHNNNNNLFGNIFNGLGMGMPPPQMNVQSTFNFQQNADFPMNFNLGNLLGSFGGSNLEQTMLNQALQESLNQAMNQSQGIPTSKAFISKLQVIHGTDLMTKKECQVCFEQFKDEDKFYKLPCKHLFHTDCILPWLEKHNTCPSCRTELPTDNLDYENRRRQGNNNNDPIFNLIHGNNQNNNNGRDPSSGGGGSNTQNDQSSSNQQQPNFNSSYHS